MHESNRQKNWLVAFFFLISWYLITFVSTAFAQMEMVATASSAVTAVVPDIEAPSIPILISPTDESILTGVKKRAP